MPIKYGAAGCVEETLKVLTPFKLIQLEDSFLNFYKPNLYIYSKVRLLLMNVYGDTWDNQRRSSWYKKVVRVPGSSAPIV